MYLLELPHLDKVIFGDSAFFGDENNIHGYTREGNARYQNQFEMSGRCLEWARRRPSVAADDRSGRVVLI